MTVNYIEAPHHETQDGAWPAIFLAGGITGCTDWQAEAVALLENADIDTVVFNPRRVFFDVTDTTAEVRQVAWEANALLLATVVLFWFDPAGMQPIAHQELGAALERCRGGHHHVVVGADPAYPRYANLRQQLTNAHSLGRQTQPLMLHNTLAATVAAAVEAARTEHSYIADLHDHTPKKGSP